MSTLASPATTTGATATAAADSAPAEADSAPVAADSAADDSGFRAAVQDHADDLIAVLDERPATIIGHSFGSNVVYAAAVRRPDLVRSLGCWEPPMAWADWWPTSALLEQATAITPGLEGPTVSRLQTAGWSAVRAMVRQSETNRLMDELWELGARAILVTSIHACRI